MTEFEIKLLMQLKELKESIDEVNHTLFETLGSKEVGDTMNAIQEISTNVSIIADTLNHTN
jgi:hypothetical protein